MALAHGWAGAISGFFIFLVAITGVGLAFFGELFEIQYGDIVKGTSGPHADVGAIIMAAEEHGPTEFEALGVLMPDSRVKGLETSLVYGRAPDVTTDTLMFSIDPVTAEYLGSFELRKSFAHEFSEFHSTLLLGSPAKILIAILGFFLVLFAVSGIYLWWPRRGGVMRKSVNLQARGKLRVLFFNWHGLVGIWLSLFTIFFALTGTALSKPDWFGPMLGEMDDPPEWAARFRKDCDESVSITEASKLALEQFPSRQISTLAIIRGEINKYVIMLKGKGDMNARFGDAMAHVHAKCADEIWITTLKDEPIPVKIGSQLYSLHGAHFLGIGGVFITVITGLFLCFLSGSGIYVFIKRTLPAERARSNKNQARRLSSE
ncbi:MAG: PepSY-associated TM helix domain-containing protein [Pseudomonadota bacterium]